MKLKKPRKKSKFKNACLITTSYPRWREDFAGKFVFDFGAALKNLGSNVFVIAPHQKGARKEEKLLGQMVFRYQYSPSFLEVEYGKWYGYERSQNIKGRLSHLLSLFLVPFLILFGLIKTLKVVKKNNCSLIIGFWAFPSGLIAYIIAKLLHKKLIIKTYGGDVLVLPQHNPLLKKIIKKTLDGADLVLSIGQETKKDTAKLG